MKRYHIMKRIVENKQAEKVDGYLVDMASASLYCQIWEKVSVSRKEQMEALNTASAIMLCWKISSMK